MPTNRWVDRTQPQTLMLATVLMYINAAFGVIDFEVFSHFPIGFVLVIGPVPAGWGIANEKKWAYWLGLALAVGQVVYIIRYFSAGALLQLIFYGALVALLLHPHSRSYRRTWFR